MTTTMRLAVFIICFGLSCQKKSGIFVGDPVSQSTATPTARPAGTGGSVDFGSVLIPTEAPKQVAGSYLVEMECAVEDHTEDDSTSFDCSFYTPQHEAIRGVPVTGFVALTLSGDQEAITVAPLQVGEREIYRFAVAISKLQDYQKISAVITGLSPNQSSYVSALVIDEALIRKAERKNVRFFLVSKDSTVGNDCSGTRLVTNVNGTLHCTETADDDGDLISKEVACTETNAIYRKKTGVDDQCVLINSEPYVLEDYGCPSSQPLTGDLFIILGADGNCKKILRKAFQ